MSDILTSPAPTSDEPVTQARPISSLPRTNLPLPAGASVPLPANNQGPLAEPSLIAGSVLPIQRAEELLATLPGVISARIVASLSGAVEEIHILTTTDVTPKQTVRNVESALIAHLGMHVSHKKISVAMSDTSDRSEKAEQRSCRPPEASRVDTSAVAAPGSANAPQAPVRELLMPVAPSIA